MAVVLALPKLFDDIVARIAAEVVPPATATPCVWGKRQVAKQDPGPPRIVIVPGDDGDGDIGELGAPKQPGRNPRPIANLEELFTVYLEAADRTSQTTLDTERAQYQVCRELFDTFYRHAHASAPGRFRLLEGRWITEKVIAPYGATIRLLCTIEAPVFDAIPESAPKDTKADVATSVYNVTETTRAAAPVDVATTAAIALSGEQTVDGVALKAGDRVLVKDQAAGAQNGIYVVATGAWARSLDADTSGEVPSGLLVFVARGATNGPADWVLTTPAPITLGTTALTFARVQPA